jgi:hypothetical protein
VISGMWTIWGNDPATGQDIWYWHPPIVPTEIDLAQFQTEQWRRIAHEQQHALFLTLLGQLAEIKYTQASEDAPIESWTRQEDITYAMVVPVVLAFYLPEHLRQSVQRRTRIQQSKTLPTPPPLLGETLAATRFGEVALVADPAAGGWYSYPLTLLGQEGLNLQQQLMQVITQLDADLQTDHSHRRFQDRLLKTYQLTVRQDLQKKLHQLAQQLAALYWKTHQEGTGQLSPSQAVRPTRLLPDLPHVVSKGALIPAPQPVQAILAAYSNAQEGAGDWNAHEQYPTFVYNRGDGTTHVEFRPNDPDVQLDNATIESLWHQVRQLSDIDGDVLLAMLAQAIAAPHDEKDGVWITGKLILDYRGISPIMKRENGRLRRAGYRQEDLADVAGCVSRMSNTWIRVEQWIEEDAADRPRRGRNTKIKRKPYLYTRESRLINVTDIIRQHELQRNTPATSTQNSMAIAWRYHLGSWVEPFLQGANRKIAWLLQQVLSYDPYHELWEKRMARYFTFHMRINASNEGITITREVGQIIEELLLPINQRDPDRTRKRFEKALQRLEADEIITSWGYQSYNLPLPQRKWLPCWLQYYIWVTADSTQIAEQFVALNPSPGHS